MLIPSVAVPIKIFDILNIIKSVFICSKYKLYENFVCEIKKKCFVKDVVTYQGGMHGMYALLSNICKQSSEKDVILPVYTCPTVLFAIRKSGLNPIFVDIDNATFCISIEETISKITSKTVAVIIPHMFGYVVDISKLVEFRKNNHLGFYIIEDFCQSLIADESVFKSRVVWGDFGILSFGRAKCISTIRGGAVVIYDSKFSLELNRLKNAQSMNSSILDNIKCLILIFVYAIAINPYIYAISDKILNKKRSVDRFNINDYSEINCANSQSLNKVQLAMGNVMMKHLVYFSEKRKVNSKVYFDFFKRENVLIQPFTNNLYLRFAVVYNNQEERDRFIMMMHDKHIKCIKEIYPLLSTIKNDTASTSDIRYPIATKIASNILLLPTHPSVNVSEIDLF